VFDHQDLERRLRARLDPLDGLRADARMRSDHDLNPDWDEPPPSPREAAVMAAIIKRASGWTMLLTERARDLALHSGQIAFPGGRIDPTDASPLDAALRETHEEVGLARALIEPIGAWDRYETITGYRVTPIVGLVEPGFTLTLAAGEVAAAFEAPLAFLMNPANHEKREAELRGRRRYYYAMPYGDHFIWGATAGMIRALYERLYE
jgi:8-oxo-dGTP pyrophosphatase MutT (NUDIX family)